jgi:hypothetical protein
MSAVERGDSYGPVQPAGQRLAWQIGTTGWSEGRRSDQSGRLIEGEDGQRLLTLDLKELKLVDRDAVVTFLAQCEAAGATLENCSAYIREWIARERAERKKPRRKTPTRRNPER